MMGEPGFIFVEPPGYINRCLTGPWMWRMAGLRQDYAGTPGGSPGFLFGSLPAW